VISDSHHFHLRLMLRMYNLRPDEALSWKAEDRRLGRSVSVIWKAGTFKVVEEPSGQFLGLIVMSH
jgi:hypothetical protein